MARSLTILGAVSLEQQRASRQQQGGEALRAQLEYKQVGVLLVGVAGAVAAAQTIHARVFMPMVRDEARALVRSEMDDHKAARHPDTISDTDLQRAMRPLQQEVGNLAHAVDRLSARLDAKQDR